MIIACLRCKRDIERRPRSRSHFCPPCRIERRRDYQAERQRRIWALKSDIKHDTAVYLASYEGQADDVEASTEWLMGAHRESAFASIDEYVEAFGGGDDLGLVPADGDPLVGARSNRGPDEGVSTTREDLQGWLDNRADDAAKHPWFTENPHWAFELHDRDKAINYLEGA